MKIRGETHVFHVNEYHFIQLYRNVNATTIGTSSSLHVVVLDEFNDWIGLANAASRAKGTRFRFDNRDWTKKASEIFPEEDDDTLLLSGAEIQALASYLNDDVAIPKETRTKDFPKAQKAFEKLKARKLSTELWIQWPLKLPAGVKNWKGSTGNDHSEQFVCGPNGGREYPHIHCFVKPDGYLYEAQATLKPLPGSDKKRHFLFRTDLLVDRTGTLASDDTALAELDKVMKSLVYGNDLVATSDKEEEEEEVKETTQEPLIDERISDYADRIDVNVHWLAAIVTAFDIALTDLEDWDRAALETLFASQKTETADTEG